MDKRTKTTNFSIPVRPELNFWYAIFVLLSTMDNKYFYYENNFGMSSEIRTQLNWNWEDPSVTILYTGAPSTIVLYTGVSSIVVLYTNVPSATILYTTAPSVATTLATSVVALYQYMSNGFVL